MNKRVLVVDDDRAIRSLLQELLEDEAYEVDTASDGLIAWEKLVQQQESYDAILLDLWMSRMNGLQIIQAIQSQQEALLRSLIVVSADRKSIQQALEMGVCHALEKPFDLETILERVALTCHALIPAYA
jgi:DNA-binding NtrC family response regulator